MSGAPTRTGVSAGVDATGGVPWSFESPAEHWRRHDAREVAYWRSRSPEERLAQAAHYRERVHGVPPWPARWSWAFVEPHR